MQARRIIIPKHGGPDVMQGADVDMPALASDKLRVDVDFAGVNWADVMMRMGLYPEAPKPPFTPGYEVAGTVVDVGDDVSGFKRGDAIVAGTRFGGYASVVDIDPRQAVKRPKSLDAEVACALPVQGITAWAALVGHARIRKGDRVLVHGGAGGVGLLAISLAQRHGATVYATAGSQDKCDWLVKERGVEAAWLRDADWHHAMQEAGGADIVMDAVGGEHLQRSRRSLAPFGTVVSYGVSSAVTGEKRNLLKAMRAVKSMKLDPVKLMMRNGGVSGLNVLSLWQQADISRGLEEIATDIVRGRMEPPRIDAVFDLEDAASAHRHLQERKNRGKVLLRVE